MRHVVLGTAGHVDHGKTALVRALTGVQTDRLPEEQQRGITIELGFAPWPLADDVRASVIDVPGHRRLVHTMIAGAAGIDLVLLVVAADEGVMPQTREHVAVCRLLGVERAVVAVSKIDRVDQELAELAAEEAVELLREHGIEATVALCSAQTGEGIAELCEAVLEAIRSITPTEREARVRLWVDRAFSVHGSGTVVTGTLVAGELEAGEPLRIVGPRRELGAVARGLHVHGEPCERAAAPVRLAINLANAPGRRGAPVGSVERGDLVTTFPDVRPSSVLDVWLRSVQPIRRGAEASIFVGTARSTARIQPLARAEAAADGMLARLRLGSPLVAFGADRFVLRGAKVDGPVGAVVGGGLVLDAHPPAGVRAAKRAPLLEAARRCDAEALLLELAAESGARPVERARLGARFSVAAAELGQAAVGLVERGQLRPIAELGWMAERAFAALLERACELVGQHHRQEPLDPGLRLQTLREQLARVAGLEAGLRAIAVLSEGAGAEAKLVVEDDIVRLPSFSAAAEDEEASRALARGTELAAQAGLQGMGEPAVAEACGVDPKRTKALLALMVRQGLVIRSGELWFSAASVRELEARVREHLGRHGELSIQDFKAMTGLGRKQAIPLLEHLDGARVTRRQGDVRVKGS